MSVLCIAGGRDYEPAADDGMLLDEIRAELGVTAVIHGGALGADQFGAQWARSRGIPVKAYPADWDTHGRAAGPLRNRQMAEAADAVVLFPGGNGTRSMAREAVRAGIVIFDFRGDRNLRVQGNRISMFELQPSEAQS